MVRSWRPYWGSSYTYGAAYMKLTSLEHFFAKKDYLERRLAISASNNRWYVRNGLSSEGLNVHKQRILEEEW